MGDTNSHVTRLCESDGCYVGLTGRQTRYCSSRCRNYEYNRQRPVQRVTPGDDAPAQTAEQAARSFVSASGLTRREQKQRVRSFVASLVKEMSEPLPDDFAERVRQGHHGGSIYKDTVAGRAYALLKTNHLRGRRTTGRDILDYSRTTGLSRTIHHVRCQLPTGESIPKPKQKKYKVPGGWTTVALYWLEVRA